MPEVNGRNPPRFDPRNAPPARRLKANSAKPIPELAGQDQPLTLHRNFTLAVVRAADWEEDKSGSAYQKITAINGTNNRYSKR
jgi:hypothetical protein